MTESAQEMWYSQTIHTYMYMYKPYWLSWVHGYNYEKVQVGKDQEKAQSEKHSHSKNRGGKKPN